MNLPNLVIIGAEKAGTTSLHYYLGLHPELYMSREKELNFFLSMKSMERGLGWLSNHFPKEPLYKYYGYSSPLYTVHPEGLGVAERMATTLDNPKLIYIVRDPIDRIVSDYFHHYFQRTEHRSLDDAVRSINNTYVCTSMYYSRLLPFIESFGLQNIYIMELEQLERDPVQTLQKLFRFLGVRADFRTPEFMNRENVGNSRYRRNAVMHLISSFLYYRLGFRNLPNASKMLIKRYFDLPLSSRIEKPQLTPNLHSYLRDLLSPDIDEFRKITQHQFSEWNV